MPQIHAKADNITLTVTAQPGGKLRVTGRTWDDALIFMPNEVLELRGVERQCTLFGPTRSINGHLVRVQSLRPFAMFV
jgi:hypothetical protein